MLRMGFLPSLAPLARLTQPGSSRCLSRSRRPSEPGFRPDLSSGGAPVSARSLAARSAHPKVRHTRLPCRKKTPQPRRRFFRPTGTVDGKQACGASPRRVPLAPPPLSSCLSTRGEVLGAGRTPLRHLKGVFATLHPGKSAKRGEVFSFLSCSGIKGAISPPGNAGGSATSP
jgi:hypothetical protein